MTGGRGDGQPCSSRCRHGGQLRSAAHSLAVASDRWLGASVDDIRPVLPDLVAGLV